MNGPRKAAVGPYARAVERLWSDLCDRAVILSRRDWEIVKGWHGRGIPLQIVEEAIDAAAERRKRGKEKPPPRGLAYIAQAVEDGWLAVLDGRRAAEDTGSHVEVKETAAISGWRDRMSREAEGSALHRLLFELLQEFERGGEAGELDRLLDSRLPGAVPGELLREIEIEATRELAPYRERMAPGLYETTMQRALASRLRQKLKLGRLSPP